jgi:hypothetical protein
MTTAMADAGTTTTGLRARIGWMLRGREHTVGSLDALSTDLRELQLKVAGLETAIHDLQRAQHDLGVRQLDELDRVRAAVAIATDDLTARVQATQEEMRARA